MLHLLERGEDQPGRQAPSGRLREGSSDSLEGVEGLSSPLHSLAAEVKADGAGRSEGTQEPASALVSCKVGAVGSTRTLAFNTL